MDNPQKIGDPIQIPPMPSPVVPPVAPDMKPEDPKVEMPAPAMPVEPVPLPKATDVEEVLPPPPPLPPDKQEVHPLFEKPAIAAPGMKEEGKRKKEEGHKLPKGVIAGVAALVFLVVGGLGTGLYLAGKQGVGELRKQATSGCSIVDTADGPGCWCANGGWQFHCGSDRAGCERECNNRNLGGPQPTNPPPPSGCVAYDGPDCGGDNQGFCTRCPEGEGGRTEYFCKPPNVGVGGGCRAPGGGGANECNSNQDCVDNHGAGWICQGAEGSRRCQQQSGGGGTCGENYIAFRCRSLTNNQCLENPQNFSGADARNQARGYANSWGCGQVDQVWDVNNNRNLCGEFIIFTEGCEGVRPTETPGPAATSTPVPPGEPPTATPTVPPIPPAATATPVTISANCESLVGQISDGAGGWTSKTDSEFVAAVRPGDRVRFVCTGHKTQGNFTKSAFFINSILHVDDVVKLNDTQFAVEYTIGAAGALKVESVLLHDSKGWVD